MTDRFAPNFIVLKAIPAYDDRDGIRGFSFRRVGEAMTEGWAFHLARLHDSEGMDESHTEVRTLDGRRYHRRNPEWEAYLASEPMPF